MATGTPISIRTRNEPRSSSIGSTLDRLEFFGALQNGVAAAHVGDEDDDRTDQHQHESDENAVENDVARQVDGDHLLVRDDVDVTPHQVAAIGEEADADDIDESGEHARQTCRHIVIEYIHLDMPRRAYAHDGTEKDDTDQAVDRDLLGPC